MPTLNITCKIDQRSIDKYIKQQRALGERVTLSDQTCAGLKLVINNRSCSWTYAYRRRGYIDGGKRHPQRTMKLGDPISMSPPEARLAAEKIKAQVRSGDDPASTQRSEERLRRSEASRKQSCAAWLARYSADRMRDGEDKYQRDELRNVRLSLQELSLAEAYPEELAPRHIRELADMHQERPATGRQRLGALSRFLDYLLDEEVLQSNPCVSVSKRRRPKPPPPRMNFYSPDDLYALWNAEGLKRQYRRYLRFMITTPLRAAEGAELTWGQIDANRAEISLSSDKTKNAEHFVMPLSPTALSVIEADHLTHDRLVFPLSARTGRKMTAWSHFNRCVRAASGIDSFILHDLRRTFSTLMAENTEVPENIIDSLLNHKQSATRGGVIRHYQQAKHLGIRHGVMKEWGKLLEAWGMTPPAADE